MLGTLDLIVWNLWAPCNFFRAQPWGSTNISTKLLHAKETGPLGSNLDFTFGQPTSLVTCIPSDVNWCYVVF